MNKISSIFLYFLMVVIPLQGQEGQTEQTPPTNLEKVDSEPIDEPVKVISFHIFDPHNKLTSEQINQITKSQKGFLENHQCYVSYGFYDDLQTELSVLQNWKVMVEKHEEKPFHLFVRMGAFKKDSPITIHYRYPPSLKDSHEIDNVLNALKKDIGSETGMDSMLSKSFSSIDDELIYLKTKPTFEAGVITKNKDIKTAELKEFAIYIATIVAIVVGSIVALLLIWTIFSKIRNRRSYRFPDVNYSKRLGAEYAATSISQIKK